MSLPPAGGSRGGVIGQPRREDILDRWTCHTQVRTQILMLFQPILFGCAPPRYACQQGAWPKVPSRADLPGQHGCAPITSGQLDCCTNTILSLQICPDSMAAYRRLAKLRTVFGAAAGLGALTLLSYAFSMTAAGEPVVAIIPLVCNRDAGGVRCTYSSGSGPCVTGQQCRALAVQLLVGHS